MGVPAPLDVALFFSRKTGAETGGVFVREREGETFWCRCVGRVEEVVRRVDDGRVGCWRGVRREDAAAGS